MLYLEFQYLNIDFGGDQQSINLGNWVIYKDFGCPIIYDYLRISN